MEWIKRGFGVLILLFAVYYGLLATRLLKTDAPSFSSGEQLVSSAADFRNELNAAYEAGQPVLIDFWADWCKNCHALDATFADPSVKKRLTGYKVIKFDATRSDESPAKEILDHFKVVGLPTCIVLSPVK
jgi:thiol:disulfide interchange protein DsbD